MINGYLQPLSVPPCLQAGLFLLQTWSGVHSLNVKYASVVLWLTTSEGVNVFGISPALPCLVPVSFLPFHLYRRTLVKKDKKRKSLYFTVSLKIIKLID